MKNEIRLALLCLAAASAPAFAQNAAPECAAANYDHTLNAFTVINPAAGAVNQQCYFTVLPSGSAAGQPGQFAAPRLIEGTYAIDLVGGGGGGGGGGGASKDNSGGGGGDGAAAVASRSVQYLAPGVYKMTLGTGGTGGAAHGGRTQDGNPTSLTNATTGQLIAGFPGADVWTQHSVAAGDGHGGVAAAGGTSGASGGSGGSGESAQTSMPAQAGGQGGNGLIRLTLAEPAPQAPAPVAVAPVPVMQRYSMSAETLFGFGKSSLKPEGEAKLDDLANKLGEVNIHRISDTGHADRIGSSKTNQKLSLARAESVKAYLVSKGIESNRISAVGKGESEPVTDANDCKGAATAKVIACLAPDRRVDIEVVGTRR